MVTPGASGLGMPSIIWLMAVPAVTHKANGYHGPKKLNNLNSKNSNNV